MLSILAASGAADPIYWSDLGLMPGIPIGPFTLRFYSLAYLIGVIFAYWHLSKMIRQPGAPMAQRHADDLFFYCTLGVIIGGRLGYAAFYTGGDTGIPSAFTDFSGEGFVSWKLLRLWDGGMSFHGGLVGVLVAIGFVSWRGKLDFLRVCDYIAVNVPMGMMLGRLANFVNGELWGRETDVAWGMIFPGAGEVARHPSQLYQAGLEGLLLLVVLLALFWKTRARYRRGLLVGIFTLGIGIARFVNEFFREPDPQLALLARETGLSMGQWLTIPLIVIGLIVTFYAVTRKPVGTGKAKDPQAA
ncbi:phosphatidylglycerol:prolipoprotein diacylglycerol transferase [Erythrobacter litoralis]|uniref:Phosphatidylglycerol--prolipoprotein diacylglyceryl transferase n=1 Tax=Erythrobacter litoralis TaxID=39960 RepID=A0A074MX06_9SPHN|nr:prolipoprotein diacylglyceryl transferase [Erythrobacter litoralis]AOL24853.1 phosphatidylglycerol:prolipoprotein diacylglycerol transferase [Erythrobacter litoralis]KEO96378.1 diacylglyceryl transferase [Erythrobacter litoralis]MEE4339162.1 prolipoprotein diacylglyceryl transferase [Erythrobacter sp.]